MLRQQGKTHFWFRENKIWTNIREASTIKTCFRFFLFVDLCTNLWMFVNEAQWVLIWTLEHRNDAASGSDFLFFLQVGLVLQWRPFTPWTKCEHQTRTAHHHTDHLMMRWTDDLLLQEGKETHRPFLLFDLLNFDLHYRCQAGGLESLPALLPPSITGTLSHCSFHPKQL